MKLIEVPVKVNASLRKMIPNTIAYLYGDPLFSQVFAR